MALVVQEAAETSFSRPLRLSWLIGIDILAAGTGVRQQQARAAGVEKAGQFAAFAVGTRAFDNEVDARPVDLFRAARMADADGVAVDQQLAVNGFDQPGKAAVRRVVAGQVGHALQIGRLIDGDDPEIVRSRRFQQGPQETAADAAVAVDGEAKGGGGSHEGCRKQKGPRGPSV